MSAAILPQGRVRTRSVPALEAVLRQFWLFVVLSFAALPALAEDSPLEMLDSPDEVRGWEAVGWVDMGGTGMCTGTLIAPDQVLTAAHCLYDGRTAERLDDGSIRFLAGWRNGQALAERTVRRAVQHPDYVHDTSASLSKSPFDLALLVLDQPIRSTQVVPLPVGAKGPLGNEVGIVSYAFDRVDAPALQRTCDVIGREGELAVFSCNVDFGSSGAPVFQMGPGAPRIVSVVLAKADYDGVPVAVGVMLDKPLALLEKIAAENESRLGGDSTLSRGRILSAGERTGSDAHFVRP